METLLLQEIKGMRKDMNHNFQALQMLFSKYFKSFANFQQNNGKLEHENSIQTQTSANDFVTLDQTIKSLEILEHSEALEKEDIQISCYEVLCQDEDDTKEYNEQNKMKIEFPNQLETHVHEIVSNPQNFYEEKFQAKENPQENDKLLCNAERELFIFHHPEGNGAITGISDLQSQKTPTSHTSIDILDNQGHYSMSNYVCGNCKDGFSSESSLIKHVNNCIKGHKTVPVINPGVTLLPSQDEEKLLHDYKNEFKHSDILNSHLKAHIDKRYMCNFCPKTFVKCGALKRHLRIHTGEKPFICNICHKGFTRNYNLKSHLRVHTGQKPFHCNLCHKTFSQAVHLKSHIRAHTGEKPFKCKFCPKTFARSYLLNLHLRVHTGELPPKI